MTRYKTAVHVHSSDVLCETEQIRDRQPWPPRCMSPLKELSIRHAWQANGASLWVIEGHSPPLWPEVSYGAGVPSPHFCCRVKTQTGKINARWQKIQGQMLDAVCMEWHKVSIFFSLNDKPNCDPFYTRTGNLRDIHLGGLFIYEQVPENRLLTPGGIAVWLTCLGALQWVIWRTNSAP